MAFAVIISLLIGFLIGLALNITHSFTDGISSDIKLIILKINEMSALSEKMAADIASTKESVGVVAVNTTNIAEDLKRIAANVEGGLTKEEAGVVSSDLQALAVAANEAANALTVIANIHPEPTEPGL